MSRLLGLLALGLLAEAASGFNGVPAAFAAPTSGACVRVGEGQQVLQRARFAQGCALGAPALALRQPHACVRMMAGQGAGDEAVKVQVHVVAAVCERNGKVLMVERKRRSRGFWEFPGGKVEAGETDEEALLRELREELRVKGKVVIGERVAAGQDGPVQVTSYHVEIEDESVDPGDDSLSVRWVDRRDELWKLAVPPADTATVNELLQPKEE